MKKLLIILLSLTLALAFAGCGSFGTWRPPVDPGNQTEGSGGSGSGTNKPNPDDPDDPDEPETPGEGYTYTVSLYRINEKGKEVYFFPDSTMNISAQWEGADGIHTAPFDNFGVATVTGLDGEYRVTLSNLPAGYTYDPNGIEADNDLRDIRIVLLQYSIKARGQTHGLYDCISLTTEGAYMVTLTSKSEKLYFEYTPRAEGIYSVESIVDIRAGKVNPKMDWYIGQRAGAKYLDSTIDGGGASGPYTKNFRKTLTVDDPSYVGNTWTFAIYADTTESYPVEVFFRVSYVGLPDQREIVQAKGPFYKGSVEPGTWQWSVLDNKQSNGRYYTDGTFGANGNPMRFKLWKQEDGGDGFYHFFDMDKYAENGGWGPMLWTLIKGWDLVDHPMSTTGKLDSIAGQRAFTPTKNYSFFMEKYAEYAITIKDPRQTDSISVHPVNEELMKALQDLAPTAGDGYFRDGDGIAEAGPIASGMEDSFDSGLRIDSSEEYMFLLFCGYFK